jgi:hypothetical protein
MCSALLNASSGGRQSANVSQPGYAGKGLRFRGARSRPRVGPNKDAKPIGSLALEAEAGTQRRVHQSVSGTNRISGSRPHSLHRTCTYPGMPSKVPSARSSPSSIRWGVSLQSLL